MGWIHLQHTGIAVAFAFWNFLLFLGYKHQGHPTASFGKIPVRKTI